MAFSKQSVQPAQATSQSLFNVLLGKASTVLLIVAAFLIGVLWTEVRYLKKGSVATAPSAAQTDAQAQQQQPAKTTASIDQIKNLFKADGIKFGDANRKTLFIEFSDPSCPYCHIASGLNGELNAQVGDRFKLVKDGGSYIAPVPEMRKLVDQGKASFVWIYSPGHGNGEMGTRALYCAQEKGKFWQVHDMLMTNAGYNLLNTDVKNDKAQSGKLAEFLKSAMSASDMKACLDSGKYDKRIADDTATSRSLGVNATPNFFVNAKQFEGAYSWKDMEASVGK